MASILCSTKNEKRIEKRIFFLRWEEKDAHEILAFLFCADAEAHHPLGQILALNAQR